MFLGLCAAVRPLPLDGFSCGYVVPPGIAFSTRVLQLACGEEKRGRLGSKIARLQDAWASRHCQLRHAQAIGIEGIEGISSPASRASVPIGMHSMLFCWVLYVR